MKNNKDIMWGVGIMLVVIAGLFLLASSDAKKSTQDETVLNTSDTSLGWTKGNSEATTTLVEYSDFQCPACGLYYPFIKQLNEEFGDQMQFTYRHFPLRQIHRNSEPAARAAEAAGKQGKFWEMHDLLFENQSVWTDSNDVEGDFEAYAIQLGLNVEQFKTDRDSKETREKINADYQSGIAAGVNSTPTFFLNGTKIINPRNYDEFKSVITQALATEL
ncbi:MAG: DsbA family protein [Patescibacteria group bacterium]